MFKKLQLLFAFLTVSGIVIFALFTNNPSDDDLTIISVPQTEYRLRKSTHDDLVRASERLAQLDPEGKLLLVRAYRSPDEQYEVVQSRCGCKDVDELPENVPFTQWSKHCDSLIPACVALYTNIQRTNGVFETKPVSYLSGFKVDVIAIKERTREICSWLRGEHAREERFSAGVANDSGAGVYSDLCIQRPQQLVIKAMLENGFCVALAGDGVRKSSHFEHIATAQALGTEVSASCTADLNHPNLRRLVFIQPDWPGCKWRGDTVFGECMGDAPEDPNEPTLGKRFLAYKYGCQVKAEKAEGACMSF